MMRFDHVFRIIRSFGQRENAAGIATGGVMSPEFMSYWPLPRQPTNSPRGSSTRSQISASACEAAATSGCKPRRRHQANAKVFCKVISRLSRVAVSGRPEAGLDPSQILLGLDVGRALHCAAGLPYPVINRSLGLPPSV